MGSLRFRGGWDRYHGWGGLVVLAVGIILLLDRLGVIYARDVFRFWPIVLVAAGTVVLVEAGSLTLRTIGGTLLAMGLILQANNLGYLRIRGDVFWPLALIGIGVVLLGRALEERREPPVPRRRVDSSDFSTRFWSGAERFVRNLESASGEHAAVFSHIERRVTDQNLERIKVAVVPQGAGVFGGFTDQTRPPETPTKRLIVTGAGVFGGVVVTNEPGHFSRRRMRMRERRWHYKD